jgi:hypothetical protein
MRRMHRPSDDEAAISRQQRLIFFVMLCRLWFQKLAEFERHTANDELNCFFRRIGDSSESQFLRLEYAMFHQVAAPGLQSLPEAGPISTEGNGPIFLH